MPRLHMESLAVTEEELLPFTIYWLSGHKSFIYGENIADAFRRNGYCGGAIHAVDWYDDGLSNTHFWNPSIKKWVKNVITKQQELLNDWKNRFGQLHVREFYEGQVLVDAVRSTYFKRIEFIETHQKDITEITAEDVEFYNAGLHDFGNGLDYYYNNLD